MSPKKPFRYWPLLAVATLAVVMILSNRVAPLPQGGAAITSDSEYQATMTKMQDLSKERIEAYDAGQTLSTEDKAKLREAGTLVTRMAAYAPAVSVLYFVGGKIHHILGEDSVAEERFQQCVFNAPENARRDPTHAAYIQQTAAESAYQLSLLMMARGDVKDAAAEAAEAVKAVPQSSNYHTALGSALNELRKTDEAKKELARALELDPTNSRAASLLRFLSH